MTDKEVVRADPEQPQLSEDPRLSELFDFIKVEEGVNVIPCTVKQDEKDTRLFIAIQGSHETASVIMAQLMTTLEELHMAAAQEDASEDAEPESQIVTS